MIALAARDPCHSRVDQMDDLLATPDCTVDAFDYIPWQQVCGTANAHYYELNGLSDSKI